MIIEKENVETMMAGVQVGAVSFADEGVEKVLDIFQQKAAANTVFITTFTHGRGLAGRQMPGVKFPDHGSMESDEKTFYGGNYATPHPEYYANTVIKVPHAPDLGKLDILESITGPAKSRNMKVICCLEDQWHTDVPGVSECLEVDLMGRKSNTLCLFNPNVREFWKALVTDTVRSYDVDGIMLFNERNGPLLNALGASHFQAIEPGRVTCFCEFHIAEAKRLGIDVSRAKEGYNKLAAFIRASLKGQRPSDGYYVEFERLLLEYPEIVAWDRLFDKGKHEVLNDVYATAKSGRKDIQVGFHIEHVNSFNPFFRATRDYAELAVKADFLKIVVYNNCGGERYANFIRNIGSTLFRDVPLEELMRMNNHLLNYSGEAALDQLATSGLSSGYVFNEMQRAKAGVKGKCRVVAGIDVNIPTAEGSRKASPEDTYAATLAALKAGSDGIVLSRKYSEMMLGNIDAAGRALREAAKKNK
ncbi:MAG TPA: hypothetical protein VL727_29625 [Puia sp.]|nr:hypothetical protein [Puia sp.]